MNKKIIIIFFSLIISLGVTLLLLSWGGFQSSNDVNSEKLRGDNKITLQNAAEKGDMVAQSELGFYMKRKKITSRLHIGITNQHSKDMHRLSII